VQDKLDSAVVILFNPQDSVLDNISTYINSVKTLYIVDNSINESTITKKLSVYTNTKIIHTKNNIGMAEALNLAFKQAKNNNYNYIMTLDQDTFFENDDINKFICNFYNHNKKSMVLLSPLHNKRFITDKISEEKFVMTSANIVNIPVALSIGGYDENLFIDEVDHEFCMRARKKNYKIMIDNSIAVNHSLGIKHKKNLKVKIYPSIRLYYMLRNYLYIKNKYFHDEKLFFKTRDKYLLIFFKNQILYSSNKIKDIKMLIRAISDYKKNIYGKFN